MAGEHSVRRRHVIETGILSAISNGMSLRDNPIVSLLRQTYSEWSGHKDCRLAASLAFYTALSLAPLLVIVVAVLGLIFGAEAARGQLVGQFEGLLGVQGAAAVQAVLASARDTSDGVLATIIGFVVLLLGASGSSASCRTRSTRSGR